MSLLPSDATADADLSAFTSAEIAAAEDLLRHSKARNTWATYRSAWKRFTTWCESRSVTALPASPQTVALYLGLSSNLQVTKAGQRAPRYKASTLRLWLVAIRQMHSANRLPDPTTDPLVTHAMDAVTRVRAEQKEGPRRVAPLLLSDISHITKSLGYRTWPDGLLAYRDSAVLWLGFVGAFRRSELSTFTVGDLRPTTEGLRVRLPFSKTNHTGEPQWNAIPFGSHPGTCPVCAIRQWVTLMDLVDGDAERPALMRWLLTNNRDLHVCRDPWPWQPDDPRPLFRGSHAGRLAPYTPTTPGTFSGNAVYRMLLRRLTQAGYSPAAFGGHSLRAGFVTEALNNGADHSSIRRQTHHGDDRMIDVYDRDARTFNRNAATSLPL